MRTTGIILLLVGLALTIFTSGKVFTKEKVINVGQIVVTRDKPHYISWSPAIGIVVMVIGGVVVWRSSKK